jgi:hypothetical protein
MECIGRRLTVMVKNVLRFIDDLILDLVKQLYKLCN